MRNHVVLSVPKANSAPPQPEILLQRQDGGYLKAIEPPSRLKDLARNDDKIIALIKSENAEGKTYSTRKFCLTFAGADKPLGMSDHTLRNRLKWLVEVGKLTTGKRGILTA